MTYDTLDQVAQWARGEVAGGEATIWRFYKLMQLIDAVEGLKVDGPSAEPAHDEDLANVVSLDDVRHPFMRS